jgi:hypothetical protein
MKQLIICWEKLSTLNKIILTVYTFFDGNTSAAQNRLNNQVYKTYGFSYIFNKRTNVIAGRQISCTFPQHQHCFLPSITLSAHRHYHLMDVSLIKLPENE